MSKIKKEVGDLDISLDLKSNMIDYAQYLLKHKYFGETIINIKFTIVSFIAFYELYFKFRLSAINPSLIWKNPSKYSHEKYVQADFQSIDFIDLLALAKNFNWISDEEKSIIKEMNVYRNKLIHFGLCEQDSDEYFRSEMIKYNFFDKNQNLVKKLLKDIYAENYKDIQFQILFRDFNLS